MDSGGVSKIWLVYAMIFGAALLGLQANAQDSDCTSQLAPVVPCLDYVQGKGKAPSSDCCSGLTSLLTTSPVCLCSLAEGRLNLSATGIVVDLSRALQLPTACKLKGADRSRCAAILGSPAPAPHAAGPGPAMVAGGLQPGSRSDTATLNSGFAIVSSSFFCLLAAALATSAAAL